MATVTCNKLPNLLRAPSYILTSKYIHVNSFRSSLRSVSSSGQDEQLKNKFDEISSLANSNSKSTKRLAKDLDRLNNLYSESSKLNSVAHLYDWNTQLKANGIRSYIEKVNMYFDRIIESQKLAKSGNSPASKTLERFLNIWPIFDHELKAIQLVHKMRKGAPATKTDLDGEIEVLNFVMENLTHEMLYHYNHKSVQAFFLPDSFRRVISAGEKVNAIFLFPKYKGLFGLISKSQMQHLSSEFFLNAGMGEMKKYDEILKKLVGRSKSRPQLPFTVQELELPRQSDWTIDPASGEMTNTSSAKKSARGPVRILIFKPNTPNNKDPNSVVLHIHGGGFVIGGKLLYRNINSSLMRNLNTTMVFVEYGLAPENKFPSGLQDCLDTYLWLARAVKSGQVLPELGFAPSKVSITGDSAGGNLTVATCIAVSEINRQVNAQSAIELPSAAVVLYPVASASFGHTNPSSVFLDPILTPSLRPGFGAAYVPVDNSDDLTCFLKDRKPTWFQNKSEVVRVYKQVYKYRNRPMYHLLNYEHFDQLKKVPLYILSGKFDTLFDDSIDIARVWKGPVTFDTFDLPHGFAARTSDSIECAKAVEVWHQRMKEGLKID